VQIIALKLILTPLITGFATWAGRRYGHNVSGLLIGLPLNAGPIALFLAMQHGDHFASISAKGIIFGAISLALFSTAYAALSKRWSWFFCVCGGWLAYLASTFFLQQFDFSLTATFVLTAVALSVLLIIFPTFKEGKLDIIPPKWDIPLRIVLATLFIIGLTYVSANLGPRLSGLLSTFPIFGTIFAVTTHYLYGSDACIRLMRSVIISLFSFSVFFVVISRYILVYTIGYTFTLATLICIFLQVLVVVTGKRVKALRKVRR